ncbi:MAG: hypothetical protein HYR49_01205 [Gammaproteobacteria bacterium]|nr:hypothetical protein [Gammaproteobacteria bacterium]
MDRREFLRRIRKPAAVLAALPAVAAVADKAHDAGAAALRALKDQFAGVQEQCTSLKDRMDKLETRQKRMMRIALAAAAVMVGIDISLLV